MKSLYSIGRSLRMGACACLVAMAQHAWAELDGCPASLDVREISPRVIEGTGVSGTDKTGCEKADVHVDGNKGEWRVRSTTINSDGSANPAGKTHDLEIKDGVMTQRSKSPYSQKEEFSQMGENPEWAVNDITREFTTRIPKPARPFYSLSVKDGYLNVLFLNKGNFDSCAEKTKNYVEKLKNRGFTINPYTLEKPEFKSFVYKAKDSAGYSVHITCSFLSLRDPASAKRHEEYNKERYREP